MLRKVFFVAFAVALPAAPASADTLRQALMATYATNPTLSAQRQVLRATDATVAIARAAGRPQVSATAGLNRDLTRSGVLDVGGKGPELSLGLDLGYPLFNGGRVRNSISAAKARVEAGRAALRAVEGDLFTEAVASYMDVIRDRSIAELNVNNVRVLTTTLDATRQGFKFGDLTRTDIAQSEARLELARANLATADGRRLTSEANYHRVIGMKPGVLEPPPPLPQLPRAVEEAVRIALNSNPDLITVIAQARAAGFDVRVERAARLPTVSSIVSGAYVNGLGGEERLFPSTGTQAAAGLNAKIPLYQGGAPAARINQAQALEGQFLEQVTSTERAVVSQTRSAFATYEAAHRAIKSNAVAVQANELALEGARAEFSVGTRTVLDVLNAEQELLNAQVALVTARRDAYVAGFQVLNAMGQAEADDLGLDGGPLYDPLANYRQVSGNWNDWAAQGQHGPAAARTATFEPPVRPDFPGLSMETSTRLEQPNKAVGLPPQVATSLSPNQVAAGPPLPRTQTIVSRESKPTVAARALAEGQGWRLQLGAFSTRASAEALYQKLFSEGMITDLQADYVGVGKLTRLQIGHYPRRSDATTACQLLVRRGQPCFPAAAN